ASLMYAAEGAKVVVAEFNEAAGEETVRLVREAGGEATFAKTNVANEASAKGMGDHRVVAYRRAGAIINTSSFVAILGCSNPQDAYTASKGAVLALTKSLAVQFAPKGVRTNAICPGPVETPLLMDWLVS